MAAMSPMTAVPEDVQEWTREEQDVRQVPVDVCPVLSHEEKADDGEEPEEGDVEAAHEEEEEDWKESDG